MINMIHYLWVIGEDSNNGDEGGIGPVEKFEELDDLRSATGNGHSATKHRKIGKASKRNRSESAKAYGGSTGCESKCSDPHP